MTEAVTTVEYDLSEIIKDPVEAIVAKLITMSTAQVVDLRDMEMAKTEPKRRSTLVSALNEVIGQRETVADGQVDDPEMEATKDAVINRQTGEIANLRAALAGLEAKGEAFDALTDGLVERALVAAGEPFTVSWLLALVDAATGPLSGDAEKVARLEADNATLRAQLVNLDYLPGPDVPDERRMKESAQVEHFTRIVFAGADDQLLTHLPTLLVEPHNLDDRGKDGIELKMALSFPTHGPAGDIHSIWLTGESGKSGRVSRLLAPLPTGGGKSAEIPAGHLLFHAPVAAKKVEAV